MRVLKNDLLIPTTETIMNQYLFLSYLDNPMQTKAMVSVPSTIIPSIPSFPRGRSLQATEDYASLPSFGAVRRIIYESMHKQNTIVFLTTIVFKIIGMNE